MEIFFRPSNTGHQYHNSFGILNSRHGFSSRRPRCTCHSSTPRTVPLGNSCAAQQSCFARRHQGRPSRFASFPCRSAEALQASVRADPVDVPATEQQGLASVAVHRVKTLDNAIHFGEALQFLSESVRQSTSHYSAYSSGLLRFEVPLPRSTTALRWLQGQAPAGASRAPHVYFSPRHSSAPDTDGGRDAAAASAGSGAVAGVGAAWLWQGAEGVLLDGAALRGMEAFLSAAAPRVRVLGGTRFDAAAAAAPEWAAFGSYCFLLPRLELLEASGCCLLCCTLAWRESVNASERGFTSLGQAVEDALAALAACRAPAQSSAPQLQIARGGMRHLPDFEGWRDTMTSVHSSLSASSSVVQEAPEGTLLQNVNMEMAREEYGLNGQQGLDELLSVFAGDEIQGVGMMEEGGTGLTKVVLARRSDVQFRGTLDPLLLLETLQERDPRAYQFCLQLPGGAAFLGSSPEQLYSRTGRCVASEAVAATRARGPPGDVEQDFWLAFDLLQDPKDHAEFTIVRQWVQAALSSVCDEVRVEREKSILKQGAVQHLYGRLAGTLKDNAGDASLLAALHPTPAVCGRPRPAALAALTAAEPFDRGFYAGPFGWVSGNAAEFAVAIRSALVHSPRPSELVQQQSLLPAQAAKDSHQLPAESRTSQTAQTIDEVQQARRASNGLASTSGSNGNGAGVGHSNGAGSVRGGGQTVRSTDWLAGDGSDNGNGSLSNGGGGETHTISMFAGVGLVRGSDVEKEWQELDLKARQFDILLRQPLPLLDTPNINLLWARLMIEELCRLGASTFCIAPGSRSSPLAAAAALQPRARIVPCIDERSLAFWALGYGQATGSPAVVITSSGTAVANLLPAVVEASQSGVPLLLLTADRPGELRDTGANQTIDQVKIFGGYTRWAADVPPPDAAMPARMPLTAVDAAFRHAVTGSPGPVHLNLQFREPLAPSQSPWPGSVLQGLERWERSGKPFTALMPMSTPSFTLAAPIPRSPSLHATHTGEFELLRILAGAQRGLIVVAQMARPEDCVAALKIARALGWPMVADVLSGLRVGASERADVALIHQFDHLLLDREEVWPALRPDVVLQLGCRLVSKRAAQFLEWAAQPLPEADKPAVQWMLAADAAQRHDQAHLVSHHIQMPLPALATLVSQVGSSKGRSAEYAELLCTLDCCAAAEIDAVLKEMQPLTEPHVARELSKVLPQGTGLFLGNSMPIRDMDMYAVSAGRQAQSIQQGSVSNSGIGAAVAANRGASGIDGVMSAAAGFAYGLNRGTTLLVGDISFLHDVNGLNLLRTGEMRPPLTVVLINNAGGGIFSFLPIAEELPPDTFSQLWATPQNVDLAGMCRAHGIAHQKVTERGDLRKALQAAWTLNKHSVVEVITNRDSNVTHHRSIQERVRQAVLRALRTVSMPAGVRWHSSQGLLATPLQITSASYQRYSLPLSKPLTTGSGEQFREGFLLHIHTESDSGRRIKGVGEIAPLAGLHRETLLEAEEQLRLLVSLLPGISIPHSLALMQGRISGCLQHTLGIHPSGVHPSVRCGLEACLLTALAAARGQSLACLLSASAPAAASMERTDPSASAPGRQHHRVAINGLLDCAGAPDECAAEAAAMAARGYSALKLKVARRGSPAQDAEAVLRVRAAVGPAVILRTDANRRWTLEQALQFGHAVKGAALQYVEEPAASMDANLEFSRATGIPIALDESLDDAFADARAGATVLRSLLPEAVPTPGAEAVVVKPAVVGGFEASSTVASWARSLGMQVVISSAFESSVGLGQYAHLAAALDAAAGSDHPSAHGLGTADWFDADVTAQPLEPSLITDAQGRDVLSLSLGDAQRIWEGVVDGPTMQTLAPVFASVQETETRHRVVTAANHYQIRVLEWFPNNQQIPISAGGDPGLGPKTSHSGAVRPGAEPPTVVFLHGFLGGPRDWAAVASALALGCRCLAVELPGHGDSCGATLHGTENGRAGGLLRAYSIEAVADAIVQLLEDMHIRRPHVVGYSLGARVALALALGTGDAVASLAMVSGTAGIADSAQRVARQQRDDALSAALHQSGTASFVEDWYQQLMWRSLREHPRFKALLAERCSTHGSAELAAVLSAGSPGRQAPLWDRLSELKAPALFIAGSEDTKFVSLSHRMAAEVNRGPDGVASEENLCSEHGKGIENNVNGETGLYVGEARAQVAIVGMCGHAVHFERPEVLVPLLRTLINRVHHA